MFSFAKLCPPHLSFAIGIFLLRSTTFSSLHALQLPVHMLCITSPSLQQQQRRRWWRQLRWWNSNGIVLCGVWQLRTHASEWLTGTGGSSFCNFVVRYLNSEEKKKTGLTDSYAIWIFLLWCSFLPESVARARECSTLKKNNKAREWGQKGWGEPWLY